ncbi:multidrug ABC transporter ATP-binding protein [bacterium E08(2017)]|nr:multidrug ABC transporter ATP-binding protein [bacterium E08(2017)]
MLEAKNLYKNFGSIKAVQGISFKVDKGEVLGFLGPNGAGKTTTMRMATGFLPPSSGTAHICGKNVETEPVEAKRSFGYLPENAPAYDSMSVDNFLQFCGKVRGLRGSTLKDAVDSAVTKCRLENVRHQTIHTLSKGYRQRTCFAQAILHDPPLLIMDEPTDGLDPNQKHTVRRMIEDMASEKAIIVSTHILEEVEAVCTRAIIISNGKVVANCTPAELKKQSKSGRLDEVFRNLTLGTEGSDNE